MPVSQVGLTTTVPTIPSVVSISTAVVSHVVTTVPVVSTATVSHIVVYMTTMSSPAATGLHY